MKKCSEKICIQVYKHYQRPRTRTTETYWQDFQGNQTTL